MENNALKGSVEKSGSWTGKTKLSFLTAVHLILGSAILYFLHHSMQAIIRERLPHEVAFLIEGFIYVAFFSLQFYHLLKFHMRRMNRMRENIDDSKRQMDTQRRTDPKTGIRNRIAFEEHLEQVVNEDSPHILIQLYLSELSDLYEIYGSIIGDRYMKTVSDAITDRLGVDVYHTNDNGLTLVHRGSGPEEMLLLVEHVKNILTSKMVIDDNVIKSDYNMGIVRYPEDGSSCRDLTRALQVAIKHAISYGRDTFVVYKEHLNRYNTQIRATSEFISKALKNEEFQLHLQPIVDLSTGEVKKAEVLLRHNNLPDYCNSIGDLIVIAEETEQIIDIDRWVITKAFRLFSNEKMRETGHILSINLSTKSFSAPDTLYLIDECAALYRVPTGRIEIEITEHSLMENLEAAKIVLDRFKERGYRLALDDFGIAYSCLNYLSKLPIDVIKIDREYVNQLESMPHHKSIVRLVIALATELGMKTVGEGIETEKQREILRDLGCGLGQGYLFDKALSPEKFCNRYGI